MFEWLAEQYLRLIANYKILLTNPTHCSTVDLLQLFTITLFGFFAIKFLLHIIIFSYLKHQFQMYRESEYPQLYKLYRQAAKRTGRKKLPLLIQFKNANPLIFTIGSIRPAIFLAPKLVEALPDNELEAALVHELTHIRRFDNLIIWFLEIFFVAMPLLIIQLFALNFIFSIENSSYALLGTLVGLILFKFVLWKRIIYLRELSCDDLSVDSIKEPLILASSLINVWRISKEMPKYRWRVGLNFTQTLLPSAMSLEYRIQRLVDYKRPWFKFFIGKTMRGISILFILFLTVFLWQFYTTPNQAFAMYIENGQSRFSYIEEQENGSGNLPACMATADLNHCISVMNQYAQSINTGDFSNMPVIFDERLLAQQSNAKMKKLYDVLIDTFGKIVHVDSPRVVSVNQVVFTTHFERSIVDIQVGLNESGKIIEMRYLPSFNDPCKLADQ